MSLLLLFGGTGAASVAPVLYDPRGRAAASSTAPGIMALARAGAAVGKPGAPATFSRTSAPGARGGVTGEGAEGGVE